jgi:uncharacterized protein (TIGR02246 family)
MIEGHGDRSMKLLPLCSFVLVALGAGVAADSPADAVKAAEKGWAVATVAGDAAALDNLLAADLAYTHSTGETDTKSSFIGNLKGVRKYTRIDHEAMEVRLYGDVAVLRTSAQVATSANGAPQSPVHLRFLHVWVKQQGKWRLVAHQSLRLAK